MCAWFPSRWQSPREIKIMKPVRLVRHEYRLGGISACNAVDFWGVLQQFTKLLEFCHLQEAEKFGSVGANDEQLKLLVAAFESNEDVNFSKHWQWVAAVGRLGRSAVIRRRTELLLQTGFDERIILECIVFHSKREAIYINSYIHRSLRSQSDVFLQNILL